MLAEGAKHILGWKSPGFLYTNAINPKLKLLLRNFSLSDDIAFRFSNRTWDRWPLTANKFVEWVQSAADNAEVVNLFMDYETFGEHQPISTGIFEFMRHLPKAILQQGGFELLTPSQVVDKHQPIAPLHVPFPTSWADEERDVSAWLGNELQNEAFSKLYALEEGVKAREDLKLLADFRSLQASDHFYYMCTKFFSDGAVHKYFNPYNTPYEAFINYMNVISDFETRMGMFKK
jgi:alpha-amylase